MSGCRSTMSRFKYFYPIAMTGSCYLVAAIAISAFSVKRVEANSIAIRVPLAGGLCLDITNPECKGSQNNADVLAFQSSSVAFPITGDKDDAVANGRMRTSFTLNSNGRLTAVTNTRTKVKAAGFTGAASIILVDGNRQPIWASGVHSYGVDGCWIGKCNRNDNWSENVPPEIMSRVRGYAILHAHNPKWQKLAGQRGEQFLRWLSSDEGKATVSTIVAIAAML